MTRKSLLLALTSLTTALALRPATAGKPKITCHYTIHLAKGFDPATMKVRLGKQLAAGTTAPKGGASCKDLVTDQMHQLCITRPKGLSLQAMLDFSVDGKPAPRMRKSIGYECTDLDHFPDAKLPKGCRDQIWLVKEKCIRNYRANHPAGG